jgi:hypothetical protein
MQAKFDAAEVGGDLDDIKEIVVGGAATLEAVPIVTPKAGGERETEVETYRELEKRRSWRDRAMNVLKAVFNNEADVQKFLESIPQDADLEVSVHIGYKTKKRRVTRAPMQQALRNLPDGEITAIGRHGKMSEGDIRLSYPANILKLNSLLNPTDVERALLQAYDHFLQNGKI